MTFFRSLSWAMLIGLLAALVGCGTFPPSVPKTQTQSRTNEGLFVEVPRDVRAQHLGADIAKTGWTACAQDTLEPGAAVSLVHERIAEALNQSSVFQAVSTSAPQKWTLSSEIRAFCGQRRGFVYNRVAGIVALEFTLKRAGDVVWKGLLERVVTDADADYTGSQVVWSVTQAMQTTMADALRLVLRDAIAEIDKATAGRKP